MPFKRIVVLADSIKHRDRCVAGIEIVDEQSRGWIRPISSRSGHGISDQERMMDNGSYLKPLDVVAIPLLRHVPDGCQTENWLVDDRQGQWRKEGELSWERARQLCQRPMTLWTNTASTVAGLNDEVPERLAATLTTSLYLIYVDSFVIKVFVDKYNKRRYQVRFSYRNFNYWLSVTDPRVREYLDGGELREEQFGEAILCVSLAEPYEKSDGSVCRYKVVASVLLA